MTPTPLPRTLDMAQNRVNIPAQLPRYSHSQRYTNAAPWQDCGLRVFMRRVHNCELGATVYGRIDGVKVALWRRSEGITVLCAGVNAVEIHSTCWAEVCGVVKRALEGC